jgi:hypothetical protein
MLQLKKYVGYSISTAVVIMLLGLLSPRPGQGQEARTPPTVRIECRVYDSSGRLESVTTTVQPLEPTLAKNSGF